MGAALVVCIAMIVGLLAIVVIQGASTFWPRPIELAVLRSGERVLGTPMRDEPFDPSPALLAQMDQWKSQGALVAGAFDAAGRPVRRQYRVGNRELGQQPFRWVNLCDVAEPITTPRDAMLLERQDWGVWIGLPESVLRVDAQGATTEVLAQGQEAVRGKVAELRGETMARQARLRELRRDEIGTINADMDEWRKRVRAAEFTFAESREESDAAGGASGVLSLGGWIGAVLAASGFVTASIVLSRRLTRHRVPGSRRLPLRLCCAGAGCVAAALVLLVALERPHAAIDATKVQAIRQRADGELARLRGESQRVLDRIAALEREDAAVRVVVKDVSGARFAPRTQTAPNEPLTLSQVVRAVSPNDLSFFGKIGVYFDRWGEFLSGEPRDSNTAGGVMPVIFGTVLLTMLLSITVVPLGVIAALYLREYATQGVATSAVRIAVNNLAGVPSIVYGVFGLGFFCYTVGPYIDGGPDASAALARPQWWVLVLGSVVVIFGAMAMGFLSRPRPGVLPSTSQRMMKRAGAVLWAASAACVALLLATTPYFHGFFRADLPNSTFGSRGLLWAALTLALLTLPVVIVATEEAIAAVPRTMREGSFGCGASRWQTIRRIVLPGAMPGIMTGMILAMARGAGEVAPLMIVGAVKKVDELPISGRFPFLHLDRTFMHLGFHIFDLGFQSPDAEAARPLVWTTTLLLITIVVLLNLVAVIARARVRRRLVGGHF
jgi:ABC-type phosphate transport system permease subunit/ABC-type phosphate transport system auxiliary subunit